MKLQTVAGLMSGTSMDGIDAAIIRTDGRDRVEPLAFVSVPYDDAFRARLRAVINGSSKPSTIERELTDLHAAAVDRLLDEAGIRPGEVRLVGFHGHTVAHDPANRRTVQIGDGPRLARLTGIDVVNDFRTLDVAEGGEGAPLAPLFHAAVLGAEERPFAVLNIGGVANVTWIGALYDAGADAPDPAEILAFDTGPGNALMDDLVLAETGEPYDAGGALAKSGTVRDELVDRLMRNAYFERNPPKSIDRQDFRYRPQDGLDLADQLATLAAFSAECIRRAESHFPAPVRRWFVTGGGRHNAAIMSALRGRLAAPVEPIEAAGWNGDALEAQAFAYLALRFIEGLPTSLPTTTGAGRPLSGGRLNRAGSAA